MRIQSENFGYGYFFRCGFHDGVYNMPHHIHQFTEIVVVLDGEIEITVNERKKNAKAGDITVIEPFAVHGFHTYKSCNLWICVFPNNYASDFALENRKTTGEYAVFTPTNSLFNYIKEHLILTENRNIYNIKASVYAVLEEYMRLVPQIDIASEKNLFSSILIYMNAHFKENLTLGIVAGALGYSKSYISNTLSTIPNMNFNTLLSSLRIEYAKQLLLTSNFRIIDIALECGFSNERSFHRAFLKLVGKPPLEYKSTRHRLQSLSIL